MRRVVHSFFLAGWFAILALANAAGIVWPDGYVVYENTESPDGRYGILVPSMETWEKSESEATTNYLANLKSHRVIGKIQGADYFEHQNHRGLTVKWAEDSSLCVAEYDARFGFDVISILEPKDSSFVQTDIGKKIEKALTTIMAKQLHDSESGPGDATPEFRFAPDHTLRVRAPSTSDPKQLDLKNARYAFFYGTFDLRSKKWLSADARALDSDQYESAESAFTDLDSQLESVSFSTEDEKAKWLDEQMNAAYLMARVILPPNRFATTKKEQIEWLKKRDASASVEEKCKLMIARIQELQKVVW
jgi:uncharacterized protein YecT (DUF1311 family)